MNFAKAASSESESRLLRFPEVFPEVLDAKNDKKCIS
jgi:hypothetical protein